VNRKQTLLLFVGLLAMISVLGCSCSCGPVTQMLAGIQDGSLLGVATDTPTPTATPVPTFTPTETATFTPVPTDTPVPTHTPVPTNTPAPTDTPLPTDTPQATDTPVPPPPAPTEAPPPEEPQPEPAQAVAGAHGVVGKLELRDGRTDYGVSEDIWFRFSVTNESGNAVLPYAILGVAASTGQFQSSWSGSNLKLERGETMNWEDKIALSATGQHSLILSMCFSALDVCQSPNGDWENVSAPVIVNIH